MDTEITCQEPGYELEAGEMDRSTAYDIAKRVTDVMIALLATVLFAPFMVLIAVAIKATSRGPVFFVQKQEVGLLGRIFSLYKFRTMFHNNDSRVHRRYCQDFIAGKASTYYDKSERSHVFKIVDDPRVTRIGRFLRRSGLDELPQLICVLKGDMSLVGPRPAILYEYEAYTEHQKTRLSVLPGITGLCQVTVRNGAPFETMIEIDLDYIRRRSWLFDIEIMFRTFTNLVGGRNLGH
jgi:lipopolysaccharide/colanic/teichoic acid biosynthesis glycosyltransferase